MIVLVLANLNLASRNRSSDWNSYLASTSVLFAVLVSLMFC